MTRKKKTRKPAAPCKVAASLHLYDAGQWTARGRRKIVNWLKQQIAFFQKYPDKISPRFRARYLYSA